MTQPLAYRMRPDSIDKIVGQEHLVGPGKIIRRMVEAKRLSSMILYGPPGVGKTSIANAIAGSTKYAFRKLNASTDKKKDLEIVAEEAKMSGTVILLLDEIHRLDQPKQDFLLPLLESGQIILVGATTENPYITIHPAIRSRVQIYELHPLNEENMLEGLQQALNSQEEYNNVEIEDAAITHFTRATNGDLRSMLNALELAIESTSENEGGKRFVSLKTAEECLQRKAMSHDKDGDAHYDVISAFQKSLRGSDVNASLHYLARLVEAGELETIIRRLMVTAYEDVSLGNPAGVQRAVTACQAARQLGFPEARIPLANAVIEIALSPKSNTGINSIDSALTDVRNGKSGNVPDHLKDTHYSGAEKLDRGKGYLFPHNYGGFVPQQYLPDTLKNEEYFSPLDNSKFEKAFGEQYQALKDAEKNS